MAGLKKKSSQGSMQSQGEAGEILLENRLRGTLPLEDIDEIGKGQAGADCVMKVAAGKGVGIGSIPFVKFGQNGAVRYRESDVLDYIEANTVNHTGEVA